MTDNDVRHLIGLHAGALKGFIGPQIILHRKVVEKGRAVKAAVKEDSVAAAADKPENHGDIDLFVRRSADHHIGDCGAWRSRIENGVD